MHKRLLNTADNSFFLFGPRGVGKSTWLKANFSDALFVDLLPSEESIKFAKNPAHLTAVIEAIDRDRWVVIDEIQKVPALLDEVHHLIENVGHKKFVLSGSSARKLKRGGANLLAGRAITKSMYPLVSAEVDFEISVDGTYGMLPLSYTAKNNQQREDFLRAYVVTYLSEEIKAEGHVRNIGDFSRFLEIAAMIAGSAPNLSGLSRDAGIGRDTVQSYFSVFEDTLLGTWLPAYRPRSKIKEVASPKFYWFDSGVLNAAAGGFEQPMPSDWKGVLFEHIIHAELKAYLDYNSIRGSLGYWSTPGRTEIDFVHWYGDEHVLIEAKSATRFNKKFLKGIKSFGETKKVSRAIVVYSGNERLKVDGVDILPLKDFLQELYRGDIISLE